MIKVRLELTLPDKYAGSDMEMFAAMVAGSIFDSKHLKRDAIKCIVDNGVKVVPESKIIQIYCEDGAEYGLFKYTGREDIETDIRECHRKAEMAIMEIVSEEDEEENLGDIFQNYLSEMGIERVFIEEEIYLPQLS